MADAYDFDPFVNDEEVEVDEEELRILEERCREIDEGRVEMIPAEEVSKRLNEWLSRSPIRQTH